MTARVLITNDDGVSAPGIRALAAGLSGASTDRLRSARVGRWSGGCGERVVQGAADRLAAAQTLAERHGAFVVLKGSGSIVARPGGVPGINASGSAALATAGTGDVLAGWIGGTWSATADDESLHEALLRAVAQHGAAGETFGARPALAGDLVAALARGNLVPERWV